MSLRQSRTPSFIKLFELEFQTRTYDIRCKYKSTWYMSVLNGWRDVLGSYGQSHLCAAVQNGHSIWNIFNGFGFVFASFHGEVSAKRDFTVTTVQLPIKVDLCPAVWVCVHLIRSFVRSGQTLFTFPSASISVTPLPMCVCCYYWMAHLSPLQCPSEVFLSTVVMTNL